MITTDPRRTVQAVQAPPDDPDVQPGEYLVAEPGKGRRLEGSDCLMFCCPGCGRLGSIRAAHPKPPNGNGATWDVVAGTLDDVAALTLSPSIHCVGCCGWHGHLTAGVFTSC